MLRIACVLVLFFAKLFQTYQIYQIDPFSVDIQISGEQNTSEILSDITANVVNNYLIAGQKLAKHEFEYNENLPKHGVYLHRNSTGFFRFNTGLLADEVVYKKKASSVILKGLKILLNNNIDRYKISPKKFMKLLYKKQFRISGLIEGNLTNKYKLKKYRTYDGSYNNLKFPYWGKAFSTFTRLLTPNYEDGINTPVKSVLGDELPSARDVSIEIFSPKVQPDKKLTLLASEIAQILAHDTNLAIQDNVVGGPIRCCTDEGKKLPSFMTHSNCFPIEVTKNDPIYGNTSREYLPFVRTVTGPREDGLLSPAEQINGVTSFLDCNFVYGNSKQSADALRIFKGGKLIELERERTLPLTNSSFCDCRNPDDACYKAGDTRVNQNPHLVAMHIIFLREHNRIAKKLKKLNPHWNDEKLFQESRRIVIAMYQRIVYKEYLPLILGKSFTKMLFFGCDEHGFTGNYDENINPGSLNSMSIVFRCYHATIPDSITCCDNTCNVLKEYKFSDYLLRPVLCCKNYDGILNSFSCLAMMRMEACVTPEISEKLFKSNSKYGLDLLAMDIQRGRDHGIPGYNKFRKFCGFEKIIKFEELIPDMGIEGVTKLKTCYNHVDDIDLLVGCMLEKPVKGTVFGSVILQIIREQFYRYMVGDRYFYTNKNQSYPFTPEQLKEIEKASIAKLICLNGNNINEIQRWPFELVTESNPRVRCSELPKIDLRPWKEKT